jgi:RNA polymerase sigma factor for flagellar operon FliA
MTRSHTSAPLRAYQEARSTLNEVEREAEILRHLPLVHSVVSRIATHLPDSVDREDLFHAGVIGLIDAIERFDPSRDNAFSTYAVLRIRGAVMDELRARDCFSRGMRSRTREYQEAVHLLSQRLGRTPDDAELADHLDIDMDELLEVERQSQLAVQISLDAPVGDNANIGNLVSRQRDTDNPARNLESEDRRRILLEMIDTLDEQERLIIKLYYFEELLMKEIATVLGKTESRICQIHSRIMARLRLRLVQAGVDD